MKTVLDVLVAQISKEVAARIEAERETDPAIAARYRLGLLVLDLRPLDDSSGNEDVAVPVRLVPRVPDAEALLSVVSADLARFRTDGRPAATREEIDLLRRVAKLLLRFGASSFGNDASALDTLASKLDRR